LRSASTLQLTELEGHHDFEPGVKDPPIAPNPTLKSVSLTHIRCKIPASLRATAMIAHGMLDRLATLRPHARKADHV